MYCIHEHARRPPHKLAFASSASQFNALNI
jgi:hypothetical protein